MRTVARLAALLPALGGCSLIYNESNIEKPAGDAPPDLMIDAEIIVDADPSMVMITGVNPTEIKEGQGAGGSRKALIVIDGQHLVKANLMVMLTASTPVTKTPLLTVEIADIDVDANGRRLAVPITLPVDDRGGVIGLNTGDMIKLDITVIQTVPGGPTITRVLPAALTLRGLDELVAEPTNGFPGGVKEYSKVEITTGTLNALAGATLPVAIRSMSSLSITPDINIAAVSQTPGPAGGAGGTGGGIVVLGTSAGGPGTGPALGMTAGAAGGFIGNSELTTMMDPNRSSGGAGGNGNTLAAGGDGGAGGGSIELTAGGNLTVGNINASGVAGVAQGANPGGGGSGGIIFLRAAGNVTAGNLLVTGFPTPGRVRFDAGGNGAVAGAFRGPMFVGAPLITTSPTPTINFTGAADTTYQFYVSNAQTTTPAPSTTNGQGQGMFMSPLQPGMNQLCLLVAGATPTSDTRTCISVAHLYKP